MKEVNSRVEWVARSVLDIKREEGWEARAGNNKRGEQGGE